MQHYALTIALSFRLFLLTAFKGVGLNWSKIYIAVRVLSPNMHQIGAEKHSPKLLDLHPKYAPSYPSIHHLIFRISFMSLLGHFLYPFSDDRVCGLCNILTFFAR
jgi:hypothetical protein